MEVIQTNGEVHILSSGDNNEVASSKNCEVLNHKNDPEIVEIKNESTPCDNEIISCDIESTACDKVEPNVSNSVTIKQEPNETDVHVTTCSTSSSALQENSEIIQIKDESEEEKNMLVLTQKIFSSLPIKCESVKLENSESNVDESVEGSLPVNEMTNICMYVSGEGQLFHAELAKIEKGVTDNQDPKVVIKQNGVEYNISPVEDEQLCNLVFEYLKLKKDDTKGIFTINIQGRLGKADSEVKNETVDITEEQTPVDGNDTGTTSKEDKVEVKEEPMETDNQVEIQEVEDDTGRRRQPTRAVKSQIQKPEITFQPQEEPVVRKSTPKKKKTAQKTENKETEKNKEILKKLYTKSNLIPLAGRPAVKTESQAYLDSLIEKSARQRRKKGLIIDPKTDIPIMEMKMNMHVTANTLCKTPQLAPSSKRKMELCDKDNIMISPGKKFHSDKLLKLYNSRLFSTTVEDSDDDLEELGLEPAKLSDLSRKKTTGADNPDGEPIDWNTMEDDPKWKTYYL